jgi:hypothetical protein
LILLAIRRVNLGAGEQNQTVVVRSVPVKLGTSYVNGYTTNPTTNNKNNNNTGTIDNIQYRDVGLVIDVLPTVTNEGYVQIKMKLESSNVEATGSDANLTPTFTKRSLTTISRVQDGVTAVVASVKQDNQGDSRATIPVIGLVPVLGRLFTTPKQTSSQSDIVITVTPHINRAPEINPSDHLARQSGSQQSGFPMSIEDVLYRAQSEEERERRLISQHQLSLPQQQVTNPLAEPSQPTATPAPLSSNQAAESLIFKMLTVSRAAGALQNPSSNNQADSAPPEKEPKP